MYGNLATWSQTAAGRRQLKYEREIDWHVCGVHMCPACVPITLQGCNGSQLWLTYVVFA